MTLISRDREADLARGGGLKRSTQSAETGVQQGLQREGGSGRVCDRVAASRGHAGHGYWLAQDLGEAGGPQDRPHPRPNWTTSVNREIFFIAASANHVPHGAPADSKSPNHRRNSVGTVRSRRGRSSVVEVARLSDEALAVQEPLQAPLMLACTTTAECCDGVDLMASRADCPFLQLVITGG
jgi:hypothetical protein